MYLYMPEFDCVFQQWGGGGGGGVQVSIISLCLHAKTGSLSRTLNGRCQPTCVPVQMAYIK